MTFPLALRLRVAIVALALPYDAGCAAPTAVTIADNGSNNRWIGNNRFAPGTVPTGGCP